MGKEVFDGYEKQEIEGMEKETKVKKTGFIKEMIQYIAILFICAVMVPQYVMARTPIDGDSMQTNYYNKESVIVEKISYHFNQLDRFDVITFYPFGKENKEDHYIKRIIGLPGETVQIIGSDIYINEERLEESYGKDPIRYAGIAEDPITLKEEEYFVLGDNREISEDSRYPSVGVVHKKEIEGRVILRVWPLKRFGITE